MNKKKIKEEEAEARAEKYVADRLAHALSLVPDPLKNFATYDDGHIIISLPGFAVIKRRVKIDDRGFGTEIEGAKFSDYFFGDNQAKYWKTYQYKAYEGEVGLRWVQAQDFEDLSLALAQAQALGDNRSQAEKDAENQLKKTQEPQPLKHLKICPFGFNHETGLHLTCCLEECAIFNQVSQDCSIKVISFLTENPYRTE
jgi:hypothetical protein